jgi:rhodanese-related sulfurtransferase
MPIHSPYHYTLAARLLPLLAILLLNAGCNFSRPDYLKTISPEDLSQLMRTQDIFLVDVHTPEQRHIRGTDEYIPYDQMAKYQDRLPKDKNTPIYLYCEGGPMGNAAARTLHEMGYRDLTNLEGGAHAWRSAGLPVQ